jgi:lysophospholipase L1-like esterase
VGFSVQQMTSAWPSKPAPARTGECELNSNRESAEVSAIDVDWTPTHELVAVLMNGSGVRIPETYAEEVDQMIKAQKERRGRPGDTMTRKDLLKLLLHEILQRDVLLGMAVQRIEKLQAAPPPESSRLILPGHGLVMAP